MALQIVIECDNCGEEALASEVLITKKRFVKILRFSGWSVGKRLICPACLAERKRNKKHAVTVGIIGAHLESQEADNIIKK